MRELTPYCDGLCCICGDSAAGGAAVAGQILCRPHAEFVLFNDAEEKLWPVVYYCGWEAAKEIMEGMRMRKVQETTFGYVMGD